MRQSNVAFCVADFIRSNTWGLRLKLGDGHFKEDDD